MTFETAYPSTAISTGLRLENGPMTFCLHYLRLCPLYYNPSPTAMTLG